MGDGLFSFALVTFPAILVVVDPLAVIPTFLTITQGDSLEKKRATALKAAIASTLTLLVFAFAGGVILSLFGITLAAFKIAGGVLLFRVALDMLQAQRSRTRSSPEEEDEGLAKEDVAIIPLGIPMLAGPGSIATVTVLMTQARPSSMRVAVVAGSIVATGVITFVLLGGAVVLERALKQTGLNILNRVMGLLLAAVAVQFVISGVTDVAPQLVAGRGQLGL